MRAPCRYTGADGPGTWVMVQLGGGWPCAVAPGSAAEVWAWIQASRSHRVGELGAEPDAARRCLARAVFGADAQRHDAARSARGSSACASR